MPGRPLAVAITLMVAAFGCDEANPIDAGIDAAIDAAPDATRDAAPLMCEPTCGVGDSCCRDGLGSTQCFALRNDPHHCGGCEIDCFATHRGTTCELGSCTCGSADLGCTGSDESTCCPPRTAGGLGYCANLGQDATNCGDCGVTCDRRRADRCDGGRCICGSERGPCEGTAESMCCMDSAVDIGCVDTITDRFHCGACGVLCQGIERCESGSCTRGMECPGGCTLGEVCCDGTCCGRGACLAGRCGGAIDGGVTDGGAMDAGVADAGVLDGGG